jgi:hypothetical protein
MNVNSVITLILGLVFQFTQVLPGAVVTSPCATYEASCACCTGPDSCHCADNGDTEQKSAPLVPDSSTSLKIPVAKASGTRIAVESAPGAQPSATVASPLISGHLSGYTGVRLSVAFCSFVI